MIALSIFSVLVLFAGSASAYVAPSQNKLAETPTGVRNENEVRIQNQGEEEQLQVETRERESTEEGQIGEGLKERNQNALQNMSQVAVQVQELQQIRTTGGIGDQVRLIARDQEQAQVQLQEQADKMESKGKIAKFLFGPDYSAIKAMQKLMDQSRVRIRQLQQLQTQLTNTGDQAQVQSIIQVLERQNTELAASLNAENRTFSLFGWLAILLNR